MQLRSIISNNLIAFFGAFLVSASLSIYWLYHDMQQVINQPLKIQSIEQLNITPGMSLTSIAQSMVSEGWIKHPYYLILQARWQKKARLIKAGEFAIEPGMTQLTLLDKLVAGKVIQYSQTLPEGLTFRDIIGLVKKNKNIIQTYDSSDPEIIVQSMDYLQTHPEGLFYPDTYHFPRGTTDVEFFNRSYLMMQQVLDEEWTHRATGLPYQTPYEALIMASIIEKETADVTERDRIAGVFVRRLQKKMKLQTDPTVIYAMGESYEGNIRKKDLYIDSPYNTYVYSGLPPTPIASPGRAAIRAALQPAEGEEIYFVARGDGTHQFSRTLEEHNSAVRSYQLNRSQGQR
ncbi:MAG: UPF0755 protein [Gammaproteobacteria bacterium]|jgi:UPF0755 protein